MGRSVRIKRYENCILTLAVMAANVLIMAVSFDFYYDLNDDVLMHDIMAGIYTGTPDGHNMQTLYPLGALIALCYRVCGSFPWYGAFLCLCQFGSLFLAGVRLCSLCDGGEAAHTGGGRALAAKLLRLLLLSLFQWGIWLCHLVNVQYTVTCAMLSAAAVFWFVTTPDGLNAQQFVVKNIPAIVLAVTAYMLRSEMFLLTFPFVCLAGLYRFSSEKKIFTAQNLIRCGSVLGAVLAGMLVCGVVDRAAYGSEAWRDFRQFFDARTTVYDFYPELITEDRYGGDLTALGVTPVQQRLLRNYDFGLDDAIDSDLLGRTAAYAEEALGGARDWTSIARRRIYEYLYRTTHRGDAPYNVAVLWAYAAVAAAGLLQCRKDRAAADVRRAAQRYGFVWQLALLAIVRSALWLFILFRGRAPERITHSLYLVEFALLAALFVRMCGGFHGDKTGPKRGVLRGMTALFGLAAAAGLAGGIRDLRADQAWRAQVNADRYAIDAYCREHAENFYFEDVYSTVLFSKRMFEKTDPVCANYDILGGWLCKSPLYYEKLAHYGLDSADVALLTRDDVYLIISRSESERGNIGDITDHYRAQGIEAAAEQTDAIGDRYMVWRFAEAEKE